METSKVVRDFPKGSIYNQNENRYLDHHRHISGQRHPAPSQPRCVHVVDASMAAGSHFLDLSEWSSRADFWSWAGSSEKVGGSARGLGFDWRVAGEHLVRL